MDVTVSGFDNDSINASSISRIGKTRISDWKTYCKLIYLSLRENWWHLRKIRNLGARSMILFNVLFIWNWANITERARSVYIHFAVRFQISTYISVNYFLEQFYCSWIWASVVDSRKKYYTISGIIRFESIL